MYTCAWTPCELWRLKKRGNMAFLVPWFVSQDQTCKTGHSSLNCLHYSFIYSFIHPFINFKYLRRPNLRSFGSLMEPLPAVIDANFYFLTLWHWQSLIFTTAMWQTTGHWPERPGRMVLSICQFVWPLPPLGLPCVTVQWDITDEWTETPFPSAMNPSHMRPS